MINKKFVFVITLLIYANCLTACMSIAVSGAQAVYNRNYLTNSFTDHYLNMRVNQAIFWGSKEFKGKNISINTFNTDVLLTGQLDSIEQKNRLTEITQHVPGVSTVYNFTEILGSTSLLTRMNDTWITSKVKTQFLFDNDINPDKIKVVTENGVVFLMGMVLPEQAESAVEIARTTPGVRRVLKLFSYVRISKHPNA